ncbi:MAG: PAS domain S-box protein [Ginsengibacter sp.]
MSLNKKTNHDHYFLQGGGEMGDSIRKKDWNNTPLGNPDSWPQSLKTIVSVMLENPFGMYIAWGKEYTQIYNDGYRPILGSTKHPNALGKSTRETFEEILHIIEPMFEGVMNGVPIGFPDFMLPLNRNGFIENCYFDFAYSPIKKEDGEVGGVLVTVIETTNKFRAIRDLTESESRFRLLAESSDILIALSDESGQATYFNSKWEKLTGKSSDNLLKSGWFDAIHPEDKDQYLKDFATALEEKKVFQGEFRILTKDGKYRWLITQGPPRFKTDGSFAGYIISSMDITERKKAEEELNESKNELQFAIDAAELATFDYNPITNKFTANARLKEWFNLNPDEELTLNEAIKSVAEEDKDKVIRAIENSLDFMSGGVYDIKYTIRNASTGMDIIVHAKGKTTFNQQNVAYRLNGTLQDITAETLSRRKIEESEQIIRNLVHSAPAGICVINSKTLIGELVNDKFLKISGKEENDIIGKNYWDCFSEAKPSYDYKLQKVIETGTIHVEHEVEYWIQGEKGYSTFIFTPLKNDKEEIIKVAVWALDNTMQVLSRQKIEKSELGMRALVESAPFPIAVFTGREMRITLANQSNIDAWGKGNDVIGKLFSDLLPELKKQQIDKQLDDVYTTGIPLYRENQKVYIKKNGTLNTYYFNYSITPLYDAEGKIYGVMNTAADVTELNQAKSNAEKALEKMRLFKFMTDNAGDPLFLVRKDGSFAYLNKAAINKWGYTIEEFESIRLPDIDPIYNDENFKNLFVKSQKETIPTFQTLNKDKSGNVYPVEVSIGSVYTEGETYMFAISRDITDRKKAEKDLLRAFYKLEESEKRFRESVRQAPFGIAITRGPELIIELVNQEFLTIINKKEEDLIGFSVFSSIPEAKDPLESILRQVYETGIPFYGNEFFVSTNRTGKPEDAYFNFVYHPLKDENGTITGVMAVATEVTATVKAKILLEESERHLRDLVTQSPIGMTILKGEQFLIETANKEMLHHLWEKSDEVIGSPILEIFPEIKDQHFYPLFSKVLTTGKPHREKEALLFIHQNENVRSLFIDYEIVPYYDVQNIISGIIFIANDVTQKVEARKKVEEAEERLRLATDATGIATWDLNLQTRKIIHSKRLAGILGHSEDTILTHPQMLQQVHPDDSFILDKALKVALKTGIYSYEARIIKADKSICWIRNRCKIFFDDQKTPIKMLGTLRDITEEKNQQQNLEASESKFRLLDNTLAQQIWLANPKGHLYYFNQRVLDYSKMKYEELKNEGWLNMVHPDDREENLKVWKDAISTGKEFVFEHRFKRFDGEYRWQQSRALPQRNSAGNIKMWVGSSTDIQEIKEQEMQKDLFISIASHELKTPLTSIKGYVQILQSMKAGVNKEFLEKSLAIVDKQINKLTQLISELLDVSKIKSGGLEFNKESFEITELIQEVVTEIKHINPEFEIQMDAPEQVIVYADRNRLGQVLINFLNNAVKYSPNTRLVKIYCQKNDNTIKVSVEDSGIGIDKIDHINIFKRFYRVEGRNEKTFPGFGIGLFISSEIIQRHNGSIDLKSELGKGSIFSFEIPIK